MSETISPGRPSSGVKEGERTDFRRSMPICEKWVYFDHAAVGPLPAPTAHTIRTWCQQATEEGDTVWPSWHRGLNETRSTAARIVGAESEEIALVSSTTHGIGLVAEGFPWQSGDNVVTLANEFPSNLYPWMNLASKGVETRRVEPDPDGRPNLDRLLDAIDDRTRIVSISWIGFASGFRIDLPKWVDAVHQRGALFFLDAIQGLGVFPLNVKKTPVDFFAADGHKWMLGPEGAGLFYLRKEHLDLLRPVGIGWNSVAHCFDFDKIELDFKPAAGRYEGGTMNQVGFLALGASLELLEEHGLSADESTIADQIVALGDYAVSQLAAVGCEIASVREPGHQSGIIAFKLPNRDHNAVRDACIADGIVLSHRNGCLRISPHAYNNQADVDRLIACLKKQ